MTRKTETQKTETQKTTKRLRVVLSTEELLVAGKTAADKVRELADLDDDLARVRSDLKARIDAARAELSLASARVSTGYEYRSVACTVFLSDPIVGKKRIVRDDTNEQVGIEDMSPDEMQREFVTLAE